MPSELPSGERGEVCAGVEPGRGRGRPRLRTQKGAHMI